MSGDKRYYNDKYRYTSLSGHSRKNEDPNRAREKQMFLGQELEEIKELIRENGKNTTELIQQIFVEQQRIIDQKDHQIEQLIKKLLEEQKNNQKLLEAILNKETETSTQKKRPEYLVLNKPLTDLNSNEILILIKNKYEVGMNYSDIARFLNDSKIPTLSGRGNWHTSVVSKIVRSFEK